MGRIEHSVSKFPWVDRGLHANDLKYTCLTLRNELIAWLRKAGCGKMNVIDRVLQISNVVEESTLTREKVGHLESYYKSVLLQKYFDEGADYQHNYRLPNKATFKGFGNKRDFVKDVAVTIVLEMYEIDQQCKEEMRIEINGVGALGLIDLDELYDRVSVKLKLLSK